MFTNIYKRLQEGFQQSRFKVLFQNTALAKLLAQDEEPSAWEFFSTYLSTWWLNRLWFRSCIQVHDTPIQLDIILKSLQILQRAGIFTKDNCNTFTTQANPRYLELALTCLQQAGILTQENFMLVAAHANPFNLAWALSYLQRAGILIQENRVLVAAHATPGRLAWALSCLQQAGILTQENFALVAAHVNPGDLTLALSCLQEVGISNPENRALVAAHAAPGHLELALSSLQQAGIVTQENFFLVAANANPGSMASVLFHLQKAGILNQENRALVDAHANPYDLERALSYLQQARILTQENFALVAAHGNPRVLAKVLFCLQEVGILIQRSFAALVAPNHTALLTIEAYDRIWSRIPNHLLTTANFQRLLTAAGRANPMVGLERLRDQILGVEDAREHVVNFNPSQSTHTASVHKSVSTSALKLMRSYGNSLNLEEKIVEIKTYIDGLDNSPKHQAAKGCIERITAIDYRFTDSLSKVSTRQLLALAYTAIHDKDRCSASLEDAKALFVEGLYEIQRGYNIDRGQGSEEGGDNPICLAGTFNKLMEKLNGIHTDVELVFITHEGASSKFPRLAQKHAKDYLQTQVLRRLKDLLERLNKDGSLEPIWEAIKTGVQTDLWDEFSEAYGNNPEDARFLALIDQGHDVSCPDLTDVETAPQGLLGHQACQAGQQHGFWMNPSSSSTEQRNCSMP